MAVHPPIPPLTGVVDAAGSVHLDARRGPSRTVTCANPKCPLHTLARSYGLRNTAIEVELRRARRKASRKQHGFWRAVVVPMVATHMGHSKREHDAVHDALMRELVGLKPDCDPRLQIRASSADMSTGEFNEWLIEQVQVWAADHLDLFIPDPDPAWRENRARAQRLEVAQAKFADRSSEVAA